MTAFTDWLADASVRRVLLADVTVYSGGVETTRYVASDGFITSPTDTPANTLYDKRLTGSPFMARDMPEAFGGESFATIGKLDLDNSDGALDDWIYDSFDGRDIVLRIGDPSWPYADYETILTGVIEKLVVTNNSILSLIIRDNSGKLDVPISTELVPAGEKTDQVKPLSYGYCYNVKPAHDDVNNRYYIHDGAVEDCCVVLYVDGDVSAISVTKYNSSGYFTLGSTPTGEITCDVKGAKPSTWLETAGEIIEEIVGRVLTAGEINSTSLSTLDTDAPYQLGLYVEGRKNIIEVLDQVLPSGWYWGFARDGKFEAALLDEPAVTAALSIAQIETHGELTIKKADLPTWRLRVGYKKNQTRNTKPSISVTVAERAFLENEFRLVKTEDTAVKTSHLLARDPDQIESVINSSTDAQTESDRLHDLYSVQRYIYRVKAFVGPYQLKLGDTVEIIDSRFGLSGGKNVVVIGMKEYFIDNVIELTCWA